MERQRVSRVQKPVPKIRNIQRQTSGSQHSESAEHPVIKLQRLLGNLAIQRLIASPYIQTKLQTGAPGDPFEKEAEANEEIVQRAALAVREDDEEENVPPEIPSREEEKQDVVQPKLDTDIPLQRRALDEEEEEEQQPDQTASVQRMCAGCASELQLRASTPGGNGAQKAGHCTSETCEEEAPVQRDEIDKTTVTSDNVTERLLLASKGTGSPLPEKDRNLFESKLDHDFSNVNIHTDSTADLLSKSMNARAFTTGHDVYIRSGEYQPNTSSGQELLAHELTHVVQQEAGPVSGTSTGGGFSISSPNDSFERAASHTAKTFVQHMHDATTVSSSKAFRSVSTSRTFIQRDEAAGGGLTPEELISTHTTLGNLDEEALGKDLAKRLPGEVNFVSQVFGKLGSSDQDDVAYEVAKATALTNIPESMRISFVGYLVTGVVTDEEEETISKIWISFKPALPETAEKNRDLWKKSLWESKALVKEIEPIVKDFAADVKGLALEYLKENKRTLFDEASRYGIDLEDKKSTTPTKSNYLESVKAMVPGVIKLKEYQEELKKINVGYYKVPDCLFGECKNPSTFNPEYEPQLPPEGTEQPPWPKYSEVKMQYDRASALISAFSRTYPTIYLLIQEDKLNELDKAGDASKALIVVRETIEKTEGKINEATGKIHGEEINHFDLKMIQTQLFAGKPPVDYGPKHPWEQPFYQDIAQDAIKGHEAREFWVGLGLSLLAAIALLAAPFTGGLTAAFLIGFGLGIGAAQAGMSWDKYLDKSTVADAKVKEELTLISEGEVTAQLFDAILNTLAVFLDVWGVRSAMAAGRATKSALELAEKGLKEELEVAAKRKALREAGKELAVTAGGTGVAIGLHELEEDEPVPDMDARAPQWRIELGPEEPEPENSPAPVDRMIIQRSPGPPQGSGSAGAAAKQPILLTGGEFEVYVEKAMLRGPMGDLPKMSFVIPGQYTGSGWGIDRIGIVFDNATGAVDVYHLEMKFVMPGSKHIPELGQRSVGTQTGKAWTKNAVDGFLNSQHPTARAGRERLRRALRKMHPGEVIDIERMRSFLHGKLLDAPIRVVIPHWADFSKLYKQVAALVRAGRDIKLLKLRPPK